MTIRLGLFLPQGWAKAHTLKWFSAYRHGFLGENKAWEFQADYFGWNTIFALDLDLIPTGSDHAGFGFSLTILGFMVDAKIYDGRHWDHEKNTWEAYDEEANYYRMARDDRKRQDQLDLAYQLVGNDQKFQVKQSVEEFLETPQGQAMIEQRVSEKVKAKLAEQRDSKEAKRARGEAYRRANLGEPEA